MIRRNYSVAVSELDACLNLSAEWIEDAGPCELNTGQTLVWSNAMFGADKPDGEQSSCIEPHSSIHCVSSTSTHRAANETAFVSGE